MCESTSNDLLQFSIPITQSAPSKQQISSTSKHKKQSCIYLVYTYITNILICTYSGEVQLGGVGYRRGTTQLHMRFI